METGGVNTLESLVASANNQVPVLDVAGMGRSFTKLGMYMPFMFGCNFCPASLASVKASKDGKDKKTMTCVGIDSSEDLENFFIDVIDDLGYVMYKFSCATGDCILHGLVVCMSALSII